METKTGKITAGILLTDVAQDFDTTEIENGVKKKRVLSELGKKTKFPVTWYTKSGSYGETTTLRITDPNAENIIFEFKAEPSLVRLLSTYGSDDKITATLFGGAKTTDEGREINYIGWRIKDQDGETLSNMITERKGDRSVTRDGCWIVRNDRVTLTKRKYLQLVEVTK